MPYTIIHEFGHAAFLKETDSHRNNRNGSEWRRLKRIADLNLYKASSERFDELKQSAYLYEHTVRIAN